MVNYQNLLILLFLVSYSTCLLGGWKAKTQEEITQIENLMNVEDLKIMNVFTKVVAGLNYMMAVEYQQHKCYMYFNQLFHNGYMVSKNLGEFPNLTEEDENEDFALSKCPDNMTFKLIGQNGILMESENLTKDKLYFEEWEQNNDTDLTNEINSSLFLSELQLQVKDNKLVIDKDQYMYVLVELSGENESNCMTLLAYYKNQPGYSYFSSEQEEVEDELVSDNFVMKTYQIHAPDYEICSPELINALDHHMVNHYPNENKTDINLDEYDSKGNKIENQTNDQINKNDNELILI